MYELGRGFECVFYMAAFGLFVGVPLAIWKAIDIGIWLFTHLRWE